MKRSPRFETTALLLCFLPLAAACGGTAPSESTAAAGPPAASAQPVAGRAADAQPAADPTTSAAAAASTSPAATPADHADLSPLGLPVYPDVYESGWVANASDAVQTMRQGNMSSHDGFDKVYAWYKGKMPASSESAEAAASTHTTDDGDRTALFQLGTTADPESKMVLITQDKGDAQTIIVLTDHTTK